MDDPLLMRFMHCGANLLKNIRDPIEWQAFLFGKHVTQSAAIEIFHHQICDAISAVAGKAEIGYIDHVGMSKATSRAGFALEALDKFRIAHKFWRDQLQRHVPLS